MNPHARMKELDDQFNEQEMLNDLIDSISIIKGNLSYIEKTGKINGTLRLEIKRVMIIYAREKHSFQVPVKCSNDFKEGFNYGWEQGRTALKLMLFEKIDI